VLQTLSTSIVVYRRLQGRRASYGPNIICAKMMVLTRRCAGSTHHRSRVGGAENEQAGDDQDAQRPNTGIDSLGRLFLPNCAGLLSTLFLLHAHASFFLLCTHWQGTRSAGLSRARAQHTSDATGRSTDRRPTKKQEAPAAGQLGC
jgi:hypothetical protein